MVNQTFSTRETQSTLPPRVPTRAIVLTPISPTLTGSGIAQAATDCSGYDSWEWAQSVYETDPVAFAGLDVDRDGEACPDLPSGFAPAFWTRELHDGAVLGSLEYVVDGDTLEITTGDESFRYRLYRANTPEVGKSAQCGGIEATNFAAWVLSFSDAPSHVWVEYVGQLDERGRRLAYIWFEHQGIPYLLNHVLVNNGWAQNIDYRDEFDPYPV